MLPYFHDMKAIMLTLLCLATHAAGAQINTDSVKVEAAEQQLKPVIIKYSTCVIDGKLSECVHKLVGESNDPYKQHVSGAMLYTVSPAQSFALRQKAYKADSTHRLFILDYAQEQHRKGAYATALSLYSRCLDTGASPAMLCTWMADCYINTGNAAEAIKYWKLANHNTYHTEIDFAIHTIYGKSDLFLQRESYRDAIATGNAAAAYALVFQDMNWEFDWWNVGIQQYFLDADRSLAGKKLAVKDLNLLDAYIRVKDLSNGKNKADSIKLVLSQHQLLLDKFPLFPDAAMCADLLQICFANGVLREATVFRERSPELLQRLSETKDKEWLHIYSSLHTKVMGKPDTLTALKGWQTYKDEQSAITYLTERLQTLQYGDPQLKQALKDFPHSATLQWINAGLAHKGGIPVRPLLMTLIREEFRTLSSDESHYSDKLNFYFDLLEKNNH
jgi:hypothetical protein